ncbi:MAG TPA: hypothetical protein VMY99_00040 [Nevskiaceae bacterium]|nr:hypothetical protein [Nevskiaceae bacterium]
MNSNFETSLGLQLPSPSSEGRTHSVPTKYPEASPPPEAGVGGAEKRALPRETMPPNPMPAPDLQTMPASVSVVAQGASIADDNDDAIDEEWVNKAKHIVELTRTDPYVQSNEISKVKAEFLKTRFNKTVKVVEEHHT